MGSRRGPLTLALTFAALLALPAIADSLTPPSIEAVNEGIYGHRWSPAQAAVATGGTVTLSNPTTTPHGVNWVGGPEKPLCGAGVPVGTTVSASGTNWSGTCTFSKPGTYTFYCTVHGPEMTGTITVTTPGAPIVSTGAASAVGETEATLAGSVDRQGKATMYRFEYGTSTAYGTQGPEEAVSEAGSGSQPVSLAIASLTPGTTYHYRVAAKNEAGTTPGADRTFTTASPPAPEPEPKSEPPAPAPPAPAPPSPPSGPTPTGSQPPPSPLPPAGAPAPAPRALQPALAAPFGPVTLSGRQRGTTVKGTLEVSAAGAGGRLEIELLARGAGTAGSVIGRFVRRAVPAGRVAFVVKLDARARGALAHRGRLALSVKIALSPRGGRAATFTRSVLLRR
jgi:plastocyanin